VKLSQAIESGFENYLNFSGRAVRSEFWRWALFVLIGSMAAGTVDVAIFPYSAVISPLAAVFTLTVLLPSLALWTRRLHDTDRSGWWMLLLLTGFGAFVRVPSTPGANRFGPDQFFDGVLIPRPTAVSLRRGRTDRATGAASRRASR
jgi:uncharacterized membrane protein YhaH (DUF805 family)